MDSCTFHDVRVEKANAISRYRSVQKIAAVFRLLELLAFAIGVSRFSSHLAFSFRVSGECLRGVAVTLVSPRFVFLLGNAIVAVLFLRSRRLSAGGGGGIADFYDEYAEKCRIRRRRRRDSEGEEAIGAHRDGVCLEERRVTRSRSEKLDREWRRGDERRLDLRRSVTDVRRRSPECRRELAEVEERCAAYAEDEMSGEEFRRTVEAFIARQQRFLREE